MAVPVFKFDDDALGDFMRSDDGMADMLNQMGQKARAYAESISPSRTGEYRRSFRVDVRVVRDRLVMVLYNDAKHAGVVEYHLDHRVLGRTVSQIET